MKRASGFVLVAFWVAFACALQVALLAFGPWVDFGGASITRALVPDLGTCVLVAAVARIGRRDAVGLAIAATIGRAAFTGASPFAVLAGSIAVAYLAGSLGRMAELDRPLLRVTSAGVGALVFGSWLLFVDFVRIDEARGSGALAFGAVGLHLVWAPLITAFTTAMVAFSIWPMLRALPGLRRLERSVF